MLFKLQGRLDMRYQKSVVAIAAAVAMAGILLVNTAANADITNGAASGTQQGSAVAQAATADLAANFSWWDKAVDTCQNWRSQINAWRGKRPKVLHIPLNRDEADLFNELNGLHGTPQPGLTVAGFNWAPAGNTHLYGPEERGENTRNVAFSSEPAPLLGTNQARHDWLSQRMRLEVRMFPPVPEAEDENVEVWSGNAHLGTLRVVNGVNCQPAY
jgi:hypothetical protein